MNCEAHILSVGLVNFIESVVSLYDHPSQARLAKVCNVSETQLNEACHLSEQSSTHIQMLTPDHVRASWATAVAKKLIAASFQWH